MLEKSLRGGIVIVGGLSVGGPFKPINNTVAIAELAIKKGQTAMFFVSTCRNSSSSPTK